MRNSAAGEVPPPGAGLNTVTAAEPLDSISPASMVAESCVGETKVVGRFSPFQRTTDPVAKPPPVTVRVKLDPPRVFEDGLSALIAGNGCVTLVVVVAVVLRLVFEETVLKVAVEDKIPPVTGTTTSKRVADSPAGRVPGVQTSGVDPEHCPCDGVMDDTITAAGSAKETMMPPASPDPLFVTVTA